MVLNRSLTMSYFLPFALINFSVGHSSDCKRTSRALVAGFTACAADFIAWCN